MKKIAFDFDGVIADVKEEHKSFANMVDENNPLVKEFLNSGIWREYTRSLKPKEGIERLRELCKTYEIHIISRRLESDRELLLEWMKNNNIEIPSERIHLRENFDTTEIKHKSLYANLVDEYHDDDVNVVAKIPNAVIFRVWIQ